MDVQRRTSGADVIGLANLKIKRENEVRRASARQTAVREEWFPTEAEEWVLFVPCPGPVPVYVNYNMFVPTPGRKRKGITVPCACDNERRNTPCVIHYLRSKEQEERRRGIRKSEKPIYYVRENYAITVVLWGHYHLIPKVVKLDDETTAVRKIWVPCEDSNRVVTPDTECPVCQEYFKMSELIKRTPDNQLSDLQLGWKNHVRKFGLRKYFNMGSAYFDAFMNIYRQVARKCECGGDITTLRYICPKCRDHGETTVIMDPKSTTLSRQEQATFWKQQIQCERCGYVGAPAEVYKCSTCGTPKPRSIYEYPVCIKRTGERPSISLSLIDVGPHEDIDKLPADVRKLITPYDFESMFKITTAEQAAMLGIPDPFATGEGMPSSPGVSVGAVDYSSDVPSVSISSSGSVSISLSGEDIPY